MNSDVGLGIAGGLILEERGGEFRPRVGTNLSSVAHGAQLMRKACYELLEGYQPLKHGGEDWYAEVCARMHGWTTRTFPDLGVMHLRHSGSVDSWLRRGVREGMADYSLGTIPGFEILKCIRRAQEKPMMMVAFARLVGYFWLWSSREPRLAPKEVVAFLQREQRDRIRDMLKHPLGRWWSLGAQ
jgi:poly-beta-1,6-N-acetyl-D-glucosamine synthase